MCAEAAPQAGVAEQPDDVRGQARHVLRLRQEAGLAVGHDLGRAAAAQGDHGPRHRHRLQERHGARLLERRHRVDVARRQERLDVGAEAREDHVLGHVQLARELLQLGGEAAPLGGGPGVVLTDDQQPDVGELPPHLGQRPHEERVPLPVVQARGDGEHRLAGRDPELAAHGSAVEGGVPALRVEAVDDHVHLLGGVAGRDDRVGDEPGDGDHAVRLADGPAHERAQPVRVPDVEVDDAARAGELGQEDAVERVPRLLRPVHDVDAVPADVPGQRAQVRHQRGGRGQGGQHAGPWLVVDGRAEAGRPQRDVGDGGERPQRVRRDAAGAPGARDVDLDVLAVVVAHEQAVHLGVGAEEGLRLHEQDPHPAVARARPRRPLDRHRGRRRHERSAPRRRPVARRP